MTGFHGFGAPSSSSGKVLDVGILYSYTFSLTGDVNIRIAKAHRLSSPIPRSFHRSKTKVNLFEQHARSLLECCSLLFLQYSKVETKTIEQM